MPTPTMFMVSTSLLLTVSRQSPLPWRVTVANVNETPAIESVNAAAPVVGFNRVSVAESQTSAFSVTAIDPDGDGLTFTLSGADGALFSVSESGCHHLQ